MQNKSGEPSISKKVKPKNPFNGNPKKGQKKNRFHNEVKLKRCRVIRWKTQRRDKKKYRLHNEVKLKRCRVTA